MRVCVDGNDWLSSFLSHGKVLRAGMNLTERGGTLFITNMLHSDIIIIISKVLYVGSLLCRIKKRRYCTHCYCPNSSTTQTPEERLLLRGKVQQHHQVAGSIGHSFLAQYGKVGTLLALVAKRVTGVDCQGSHLDCVQGRLHACMHITMLCTRVVSGYSSSNMLSVEMLTLFGPDLSKS